MSLNAQYSVGPTIDVSQISVANANRDGSGTTVEIAAGPTTAAADGVGKRILGIQFQATGTTTAGMIRIFLSVDGGTTKRLIEEVPVSAITAAATTVIWRGTSALVPGMVLPGQVSSNTQKLYAATEKAETFNVIVQGATY